MKLILTSPSRKQVTMSYIENPNCHQTLTEKMTVHNLEDILLAWKIKYFTKMNQNCKIQVSEMHHFLKGFSILKKTSNHSFAFFILMNVRGFWLLLSYVNQPIRSLQNSKKFTKKGKKIWFDEFFLNRYHHIFSQ